MNSFAFPEDRRVPDRLHEPKISERYVHQEHGGKGTVMGFRSGKETRQVIFFWDFLVENAPAVEYFGVSTFNTQFRREA